MPEQYGSKKLVQSMNPDQLASANFILPYMAQAIQRAENDPTGMMGVRSLETAQPSNVLNNSIINNFARWIQASQPGKFVDFMQQRWAPMGVANDPNNLNANWAPNVRSFLQELLGNTEYERWKKYNMVRRNDAQIYRA